jgi:hypothetical protein
MPARLRAFGIGPAVPPQEAPLIGPGAHMRTAAPDLIRGLPAYPQRPQPRPIRGLHPNHLALPPRSPHTPSNQPNPIVSANNTCYTTPNPAPCQQGEL